MHNIVTFVWKGERSYTIEHAAILFAGLKRFMSEDFTLTVITDDAPVMASNGFRVVPLPESAQRLARMRTPENEHFPSSYRRLWLFSEEAQRAFRSSRVMLVDVDVAVTGDWVPLFDYEPDAGFVGWRPFMKWGSDKRLAGGQWLLRTGAHLELWDKFIENPEHWKKEARVCGFRGSDQAWISYMLRDVAPVWPKSLGVYSIRDFTRDQPNKHVDKIPDDARVVHFNGKNKPWDEVCQRENPWLKKYMPDFCQWHV